MHLEIIKNSAYKALRQFCKILQIFKFAAVWNNIENIKSPQSKVSIEQGRIVHRSGLKIEKKILLFDLKDFNICKYLFW